MKNIGELIGDYIYIIFIVVAAIVSLLGKSKKKTVSQHPKPTETLPQDWEDVFGELFGKKKPQPVARQTLQPENRKVINIKTQKPVYQPIPIPVETTDYEEGTRAITNEISIVDIEEDTAGFSLDNIPNSANEWRKVFVYKEIFDRKY